MEHAATPSAFHRVKSHLRDAERWMDKRGKSAWIFAMVLGFVFIWPVGLALLFYMIWSNKMKSSTFACNRSTTYNDYDLYQSSGNSAFDSYKADTMRRLEQEQEQFRRFMQRLADAKDKAEFDQFMAEREAKIKSEAVSADV